MIRMKCLELFNQVNINGVFRIIEELIRIVNKLKKLITKTLL